MKLTHAKMVLNTSTNISAATLLVCATVVGLSSADTFAQSRVLQYDSKGRVISSEKYDNKTTPRSTATPRQSGSSVGGPSASVFDGPDVPDWDRSVGEGPGSDKRDKPPYEPGEVLVMDPSEGFEGKATALGFRVIETQNMKSLGIRMLRLSTPARMTAPDAVKLLSREFPGILFDLNTRFIASAGPKPLHPRTARVLAGWQGISPTCGKHIKIGMIDTGVDLNHPALKGQQIAHRSFPKAGRRPGNAEHGTAIANILVGKPEWGGLLPGARLYAANMFEINEKGETVGSAAALIKSMEWMSWLKVDAVNLSIAGDDNKLVRRALDIADRAGLLLVASVGSWGNSSRRAFPAAYDDVIAVTALKGKKLVYKYANSGPHIDFAAPGTGIWSAKPGGGGGLHYGTSFAVPYITATAGILKRAGRANDADKFRKLLSRAVKDLGKPGRDDVFGYGALNVRPACKG